jgi:hypothetical protein
MAVMLPLVGNGDFGMSPCGQTRREALAMALLSRNDHEPLPKLQPVSITAGMLLFGQTSPSLSSCSSGVWSRQPELLRAPAVKRDVGEDWGRSPGVAENLERKNPSCPSPCPV